jgi:hypothetical protein
VCVGLSRAPGVDAGFLCKEQTRGMGGSLASGNTKLGAERHASLRDLAQFVHELDLSLDPSGEIHILRSHGQFGCEATMVCVHLPPREYLELLASLVNLLDPRYSIQSKQTTCSQHVDRCIHA